MAARRVHEQRQRVRRVRRLVREQGALFPFGPGGDLDGARLELGANVREVVFVEVVLERERFELVLGRATAFLGLLEEAVERCFNDGAQFYPLLRFVIAAARRRSNRSIRLPAWIGRSTPV